MGPGPEPEPLGPASLARIRVELPFMGPPRVAGMTARLGVAVAGAILGVAPSAAPYALVAMAETHGVRVKNYATTTRLR